MSGGAMSSSPAANATANAAMRTAMVWEALRHQAHAGGGAGAGAGAGAEDSYVHWPVAQRIAYGARRPGCVK